jgi:hypothetical protein
VDALRPGSQTGQVLVPFALGMFTFIAFAALVIDGANLYAERRALIKAAADAALAGASEYAQASYLGPSNAGYPLQASYGVQLATAEAVKAARANAMPSAATVDVAFVDHSDHVIPDPTAAGPADIRGVSVTIRESVGNFFGPAVGLTASTVAGQQTAQIGAPATTPVAPLVLHNWDTATLNVPRDSPYGAGAGACPTNPGDGNTYASVPDCRPSIGPTNGTGALAVNLVPYYETTAPAMAYPVGFSGAPTIGYSVIHDPASCATGDSGAPPPYSVCSADHGIGDLTALENGLADPMRICGPTAPCGLPQGHAEQTRRRSVAQAQYDWVQQAPPSSPPPRAYPSMAYDPLHHDVVLFGGYTASYEELSDTWTWDGTTWAEVCASCGPPARLSAGMAYDSAHNLMVLFGGYSSTRAQTCGACGFFGDTWTFDGSSWSQLSPAHSPSPRWYPAMSADARSDLVLFGGLSAGNPPEYFGDTWTWDGADWTPRCGAAGLAPCPLPGRWETPLAYASSSGQAILYGGDNGAPTPYLQDTWAWDGSAWAQITLTGSAPGPRTNLQAAFNTVPAGPGPTILLYGGGDGTTIHNDTHILNPTSGFATLTPAHNPGPTRSAGTAYDAAHGVVVLFGGGAPSASGSQVSSATWLFEPTSVPPEQSVDDDYVLTAFNQRIGRAMAGAWAAEDCSQPYGNPSAGVLPLRSDNPRLVRFPIEYGPPGQLSAIAGQNNVGAFRATETIDFCIQNGSPSAPLPARSTADNSYSLTGYIVQQPAAGDEGLILGQDYFGADITVRLVPNP